MALHRAARGPDHQGDWAWTPPSGARLPDEPVELCARRELVEETGLKLSLQRLPTTAEDWAVFVAEAPADAQIVLDGEHDRFAWLTTDELLARCAPAQVTEQIRHAIEHTVSTRTQPNPEARRRPRRAASKPARKVMDPGPRGVGPAEADSPRARPP